MSSGKSRILSVSLSESLRVTRHRILTNAGYEVATVGDWHEFEAACTSNEFDLAILGQSLPPSFKRDAAELIKRHCPQLPILEIYIQDPVLENSVRHHQAISPLDPAALLEAVREGLKR
jgi:DNA-binding NtrC family response regulator